MREGASSPGWSWKKGCGISCLGLLLILLISFTALVYIVERANRPPSITLPPLPKPPSPNAHDDWVRAGALAAGIRPVGPVSDVRPIDDWTVPELKEFVQAHREAFEVFHGSLGKDNLFPHGRDANQFTGYAHLRELARRVSGEAYYYERINQPEKAAEVRLDLMEMGARLPKNSPHISHLVGNAIVMIGMDRIPRLLPKLDREGLQMVIRRVDEINAKQPPLSEIVLEEAYTSVHFVQQVYSTGPGLKVTYDFWQFDIHHHVGTPLQEAWRTLEFALRNKESLLRQGLQDAAEAAPLLDGPYDPKVVLPQSRDPLLMNYFFDSMWLSRANQQAQLALLQAEAALRLYQKDFGRYPQSLKELTPRYLDEVPLDWFGGKPLKYKPLEDGQDFKLYSVGRDLKDDGGKALPGKGRLDQPDIVLTGRKAQP